MTDLCVSLLTDKILEGFDEGLIIGMILINPQKSFDLKNQEILLKKRESLGLFDYILVSVISLFRSYLSILGATDVPYQPVITTRIYVLHKITIALKFMSYINYDLQIPAKKLQTPG